MDENQPLEAVQDRKVTWGLIAIVAIFVLVMTGIVLWVTSTLIQNELGGPGSSGPLASATLLPLTPTLPPSPTPLSSATPLPSPTSTEQPAVPLAPVLVDATWTPISKSNGYVKFLYWFVKPNQVVAGECLQLTWETENAVSLQLYRNGELILEDAPAAGTLQDCPRQPGYAVYRMVCENSRGQSNWIQLQVKVEPAP